MERKNFKSGIGRIKNGCLAGGLNLPCLETMNRALVSSQCIRLLKSEDRKSIDHLDYWMGSLLQNVFPDMGHVAEASSTPQFFTFIADNLAELIMNDLLNFNSVTEVTNKLIYSKIAQFPAPKVVVESNVNYTLAWKRLHDSLLSSEEKDHMFMLLHNKLPVLERLHRLGVKDNPSCLVCPGQTDNILHHFCSCLRTKRIWL